MERQRQILDSFADLLGYPGCGFSAALLRGSARLAIDHAPTATLLRPLTFAAGEGAAHLEELYTATFDLQPSCSPYVAWHLCGESRARTLFLLRLREHYREHGFEEGGDLPDHLAALLRFLAEAPSAADREAIVIDALLPALQKMLGGFADAPGHPYGALLLALQAWLTEEFPRIDQPVEEVSS